MNLSEKKKIKLNSDFSLSIFRDGDSTNETAKKLQFLPRDWVFDIVERRGGPRVRGPEKVQPITVFTFT